VWRARQVAHPRSSSASSRAAFLIPIYGQYVFLPKMAWRIGHNDHPYWQNWHERVAP
jgi:hypothetical protein